MFSETFQNTDSHEIKTHLFDLSTKQLFNYLFCSIYHFFSLLLSLVSSLCRALYDMWAVTMMSSFTHQRSEASLTEREGPPKHSLSHLPHSPSIIDKQLSVEKAARLSVDLFDKYFSWQTGHLTLCTKAMCG